MIPDPQRHQTAVPLPARSPRYSIGKEIGGAIYVHRRYEDLIGDPIARAKACLPSDALYHVVKYNQRTQAVSFIQSDDFDTCPEPTLADIWTVHPDGRVTRRCGPSVNPFIYHHKWLFVADDYNGFDVTASKARSLAWAALPGVDRSRIGRLDYWRAHVLPRLEAEERGTGRASSATAI